ncbi:MAG: ABC transporter ATP-binding protein [Deltaproteobacteria bacterium]|nr:ABC transporter ATP-binding protein [Deltaproteobacteria bacterium]
MTPVIFLDKIEKRYESGSVVTEVLKGVSFSIFPGELVSIMGPSGAGKSTLLYILGCLARPSAGQYKLDGVDVGKLSDEELSRLRNAKLGFVFQSFHLIPQYTALENVLLPTVYRRGRKQEKKRDIEKAKELLNLVGLEARYHYRPGELSGGQKQRVAIARALMNDPEVILADEPTGNLDSHQSDEIVRLLLDLNERGRTIIMVTHDPEVGRQARRMITIRDGLIQSDVPCS